MIENFRHKGLRQFFETGDHRGINPDQLVKIRLILFTLQSADTIDVMRLPSFRLQPLVGDLEGFWAVTVRANWRVIFRFEGGTASEVDLIDYH